jgi:GAF domain-containing protein
MTDIETLLPVLTQSGQPDTLFKAMEAATHRIAGHQLFTLLYVDGTDVARCYSNRPEEYPVAGRKPMGPTPWGELVLTGKQPFLGRDKAAIRWAFFDHALIEGMGLGSAICVPIVYDGATIGSMNLLHTEHFYQETHVAPLVAVAPLLIPAFLQARSEQRSK